MKNIFNKIMAVMTIVMSQVAMALCSPVFAEGDGVLGYDIGSGTIKGGAKDLTEAGTKLQDKGQTIYYIIVGLALIVVLAILVFHGVKLAKSGDNPSERSRAISGIIYTIVAAAIIGGAVTLLSTFFNVLN